MTFDPIAMDNSCHPQLKQKQLKEQRNLSRKQDLKPVSPTDKWTERAKKQTDTHGQEVEDKRSCIMPQHIIEVDVEINFIENSGQKTPPLPVKPCSKRKSTTPQRARRKACPPVAAADDSSPPPGDQTAAETVPSSPSRASIISETAAEELCDLRNYYSKQLRRINYVSHEYLGQPANPGVLACIREPLRSIRLPCRVTIAQTARSLWTRVSGRRKLLHH